MAVGSNDCAKWSEKWQPGDCVIIADRVANADKRKLPQKPFKYNSTFLTLQPSRLYCNNWSSSGAAQLWWRVRTSLLSYGFISRNTAVGFLLKPDGTRHRPESLLWECDPKQTGAEPLGAGLKSSDQLQGHAAAAAAAASHVHYIKTASHLHACIRTTSSSSSASDARLSVAPGSPDVRELLTPGQTLCRRGDPLPRHEGVWGLNH